MSVTLTVIRSPDGVVREQRDISNGDLTIGRGSGCDWVLPDPDKVLSKQHCRIEARGDTWLVTDTSANGTLLNGRAIENRLPFPLRAGDRLTLGGYEIEFRLEPTASGDAADAPTRLAMPPDPDGNLSSEERLTSDPFPLDDDDPLEVANPSVVLPLDLDTLLEDGDRIPERPFPEADQTSDLESHFRPPRPSVDLLPEDWDVDDAVAVPSAHDGSAPALPTRPAGGPSYILSADADATAVEPSEAGFAAFLAGARVRSEVPADPDAALHRLGAAFRVVVSGLRQSMIARAAVKSEFRIGQTMIRPAGNNPLKFSADDDDALAALLGLGRQSSVTAAAALAEALRDIRLHELATAAALQSAVRDLLAQISPERLMRGVRPRPLDDLLKRRKQAAWDTYVVRHAEVTQALGDDFDSVFGRAFARAYEAALDTIATRETDPGDVADAVDMAQPGKTR
ncbi:type VI secretion system FHA domain protein [Methylobacterium sp. OAE515]|uniref:type VI secretion system-associated FHA domain protein TagH n=1 Tax=Methylobacterium sp. OAE515 TaxID=2817895 RepID=UPI0017898488